MSTLQSQPGNPAIITDNSVVIDYQFPPTNYQAAPQPTRDLESVTAITMTTDERISFTPAKGYLIWDTTQSRLFSGNGRTPGGVLVGGGSGGDFTRVVFHDGPVSSEGGILATGDGDFTRVVFHDKD